ncbi:ArsR/SmtB family transcription factor, partial [Candidatus Auribacterota bacterium]
VRSKIVKALAHPTRIMMVEFLKTGEKSFSEIFQLFELDKSTISKHLLVLKDVGILSSQKNGWDMVYKLETPCITDFFKCVSAVIEHKQAKKPAYTCKR